MQTTLFIHPNRWRAAFAVAVAACLALVAGGCERLVERQIESNLTRQDTALLAAPDLTVVLCGTGSPLPDPARASACTAVVAAGELVLVDAGSGSWEVVDLADLPTAALSAVLLTHFHSDHIGDLGEAMTQSWIAGRSRPLEVYGPAGAARVVNGFREAYAADVDYRVAHHGDEYLPRASAGMVAHEVELGDDDAAVVFERSGLKVTMFRVDHEPVDPAVGYRFDYRGRSVVVSGDTKKSPSLVRHAAGADILIHEALQPDMVARAARAARRLGLERVAHLASDIPTYHATPVEAAQSASEAGVAHLVFTHMVPAPANWIARRMFLRGVGDAFAGQVTLGEDGMRFTLPPRE